MTPKTEADLIVMLADLNFRLDRLHDALLAKLRSMARSTGQRTRADRL
jgi:hypothetical protein